MYTVPFSAVNPETASQKAGTMVTLLKRGLPVPKGFVITKDSFSKFLESGNIRESEEIIQSEFPGFLTSSLKSEYEELGVDKDILGVSSKALDLIKAGRGEPRVAVRTAGFSRLNVKGLANLQQAVKECWAHSFGSQGKSAGEIIVQKMVDSEKTGVLFPHPSQEGVFIIESTWGHAILGGFNPDMYRIDGEEITGRIGEKTWFVTRDSLTEKTIKQSVLDDKKKAATLDRKDIDNILKLQSSVEDALGPGFVVEFGIERGRTFILQSSPRRRFDVESQETSGELVCEGDVICPGYVEGKLRVIKDLHDLDDLDYDEILVANALRPEFLKKKPAGIITQNGSLFRLGGVVNVPTIRVDISSLEDGRRVLLDAVKGGVFSVKEHVEEPVQESVESAPSGDVKVRAILSNLDNLPEAEGFFVRGETILADRSHPSVLARENPELLSSSLEQKLEHLARKCFPKSIWYRGFDGRTDEMAGFGEEKETNPILGWHGIRRGLKEGVMSCELEALKRLYQKGLNNITYMLPFVSRPEEVKEARELISFPLKVGIMIETPSSAIEAEQLCREGLFAVHIDVDALTQLTLGMDMDNPSFSSLFSTINPPVEKLLKLATEACKKYKVETSVSGEALNNPGTLPTIRDAGINSISLHPDSIEGANRSLEQ